MSADAKRRADSSQTSPAPSVSQQEVYQNLFSSLRTENVSDQDQSELSAPQRRFSLLDVLTSDLDLCVCVPQRPVSCDEGVSGRSAAD